MTPSTHHVFFLLLALFLLLPLLSASPATDDKPNVVTLVRHPDGDYYVLEAPPSPSVCRCLAGGATTREWAEGPLPHECHCHCPPSRPLLRDDTLACTRDVEECLLAEFVGPEGAESVPHVFLPAQGQLINPAAEVALLGLEAPGGDLVSPVCVVTEAQKLTRQGWQPLPNNTNFEPPFRLYRQQGRTYLRWVGDAVARWQVEGHLVLVTLLCRDTVNIAVPHFSPCVAFRAAGSVALDRGGLAAPEQDQSMGYIRPWLIGGAVLGGAVVLYLTVVVCLLHRRGQRRARGLSLEDGAEDLDSSKRRKFSSHRKRSTSLSKQGSLPSQPGGREQQLVHGQHLLQQTQQQQRRTPEPEALQQQYLRPQEDIEDLTGRSHLVHNAPSLSSASALVQETADLGEGSTSVTMLDQQPTPPLPFFLSPSRGDHEARPAFPGGSGGVYEPLPENNTCQQRGGDSEGPVDEVLHADAGPSARKKLYFNPSYFEPELLQEPPPAALDFLDKIREIISSAKSKMRNRTFQPSLNDIPEDDYTYYTQSRPQSRSTAPATPGARSRVSFRLGFGGREEVEDLTKHRQLEYENVVSSDPQQNSEMNDLFAVDSLDEGSDAGSRTSTLKRIAKRVNERGSSLVSEIIKTLDRKNRDAASNLSYCSSNLKQNREVPSKVDQLVRVHSYGIDNQQTYGSTSAKCLHAINIANSDDLIKPSALRSILKDGKQKSEDATNTFENFCQEMIATFNRLKKYGEAKTPVSTIGKRKRKSPTPREKDVQKEPESGDGKVRQWLEGLDKEGLYSDQVLNLNRPEVVVAEITPLDKSFLHVNDTLSQSTMSRRAQAVTNEIKALHGVRNSDRNNIDNEVCKDGIRDDYDIENTYEEIKQPKKDNIPVCRDKDNKKSGSDVELDGEGSSYSDEGSLVSAVGKPNESRQEESRTAAFCIGNVPHQSWVTDDELNTSFDPDTLERQPKRRSARSRSIIRERCSDYCTSDSEDIYDATSGLSVQSAVTVESVKKISSATAFDSFPQPKGIISNRPSTSSEQSDEDMRSVRCKPPLPPKQCSSPERASISPPLRPPKSSTTPPTLPEKRPPIPPKGIKMVEPPISTKERPVLPKKMKKAMSHFNSEADSAIPELSDEAAATILLGLQAHTSPLALFCTSTDQTATVRHANCSPEKTTSLHTESKFQSNVKRTSMKRKVSQKLSAEAVIPEDMTTNSISEERIRGQFILAPEGKSPVSRRSSLSRSGQGSRSSSSDTDISNKNVKLCQCAKTELEKHFIEKGKSDADTIKKTWRRVMKKSDESSEKIIGIKSNLANINEEEDGSERCKKCTVKQKQEDSGYQSSDSCGTEKSHDSSYYESSCSIDIECTDDALQGTITGPSKRSTFGPQIFPKSHSLQHLKDVPVRDVYKSFEGSPCSSRSSSSTSSVKEVTNGDEGAYQYCHG